MKNTLFASAMLLTSLFASSAVAEGVWNSHECHAQAEQNGVVIKTDGSLSDNSLFFRIITPGFAKGAPDVFLDALGDPLIHVEGIGRSFSFQLLYTPLYVSKLLRDDSKIVIQYTTENNEDVNVRFPTKKLPLMIAKLADNKACGIQ